MLNFILGLYIKSNSSGIKSFNVQPPSQIVVPIFFLRRHKNIVFISQSIIFFKSLCKKFNWDISNKIHIKDTKYYYKLKNKGSFLRRK